MEQGYQHEEHCNEEPDLQGWLLKRGPGVRYAWERRWCVLRFRTLLYCFDEKCSDKKGEIKITPATVVRSFQEKTAPGDACHHRVHRPFGFVIDADPTTKRRHFFYFDAEQEKVLADWKTALKKAAWEALSTIQPAFPTHGEDFESAVVKLQRDLTFKVERLGYAHQEALQCAAELAECVRIHGRATDAEDLHRRTLEVRESMLGQNHPHTLLSRHFLALCLRDQSKYGQAEAFHQQALDGLQSNYGPDHPYTIALACSVAACFQTQKRFEEAEPFLRKALDRTKHALGMKHHRTLMILEDLADNLGDQGKHKEAEVTLRQAVEYFAQAYDKGHPKYINVVDKLASCLTKQGRDWEVEALDRETLSLASARNSSRFRHARVSFQGQLMRGGGDEETSQKMMIITDIGQDNDDEMALLLLSELMRNREVELLAVIANLRPASERAALARGTLDMLGLANVPVGIGTDGGSSKHDDTFSEYISEGKTGVDYIKEHLDAIAKIQVARGTPEEGEVERHSRIFNGMKLMRRTLQQAEDNSVTLLILSSLKDAAELLREDETLFQAKIRCITIMGGVKGGYDSLPKVLEPSDAHNNLFDMRSAEFFYERCQELGIGLVILSRFAAYGCPVQRKVYDLMIRCPVPNPVLCRLHRAQRSSIERLWNDVCTGGKLPARCDKKWFCETFCEGRGANRELGEPMWDLIRTFNMYDPMAVLASIPSKREFFFNPIAHVGLHGVTHLIIGIDRANNGILNNCRDDLHDFLQSTWIRASGRPRGGLSEKRPEELDLEQMTAALDPMAVHTKEEMEKLNQSVLGLLGNEWPRLKNSSLLKSWRERDSYMRQIGGPPMLLLDFETVERLGRIPHSAEQRGITMAQANALAEKCGMRFFIEMFSHRWSSRFAPDDRWNSKARAIVEWGKYRSSMGLRTFFWVDYTCINQDDIGPGVSMLPLYVSSCNNIICYDTPPYEPRAWCRVERLMFAAFVAPNNEFMSPDFTFDPDSDRLANKELRPKVERKALVPDPAGLDTQLSYAADGELIKDLKKLCATHWASCWKEGLMKIMTDKGYEGIPELKFGVSELRLRMY